MTKLSFQQSPAANCDPLRKYFYNGTKLISLTNNDKQGGTALINKGYKEISEKEKNEIFEQTFVVGETTEGLIYQAF